MRETRSRCTRPSRWWIQPHQLDRPSGSISLLPSLIRLLGVPLLIRSTLEDFWRWSHFLLLLLLFIYLFFILYYIGFFIFWVVSVLVRRDWKFWFWGAKRKSLVWKKKSLEIYTVPVLRDRVVLSNFRIWIFLGKCPSNEKHLFFVMLWKISMIYVELGWLSYCLGHLNYLPRGIEGKKWKMGFVENDNFVEFCVFLWLSCGEGFIIYCPETHSLVISLNSIIAGNFSSPFILFGNGGMFISTSFALSSVKATTCIGYIYISFEKLIFANISVIINQ